MKAIRTFVLFVALMVVGVQAQAAGLELTGVTLDTAAYFAGAIIVFTALAAIWPVHKIVKLLNKS